MRFFFSLFSPSLWCDADGRVLIGYFWLWRVWECETLGWLTGRISYCSRQKGRRRAGLQCGSARVCAGWSPEKTFSRSLQRCTDGGRRQAEESGRSNSVTQLTLKAINKNISLRLKYVCTESLVKIDQGEIDWKDSRSQWPTKQTFTNIFLNLN